MAIRVFRNRTLEFFTGKSGIFMKYASFAFYLKVRDLDLCRRFYSDLLGLGAPVVNSNFWVEFEVSPGVRLILDRTGADCLDHAGSAGCFTIFADDAEELIRRLEKAGYAAHASPCERPGYRFMRCLDPEENPFLIAAAE